MKKTLLSSLVIAVLLSGCGGGGGDGTSSSGSNNAQSNPSLVDSGIFSARIIAYRKNENPSSICGSKACYKLSTCTNSNSTREDNNFYIYSNGVAQTVYPNSYGGTVTSTCEVEKAYKEVSYAQNTNFSDALWSTTQRYYSSSLKTYFVHSSYVYDPDSTLTLVYNNGQNATIQYANNGGTTNVPISSIVQEISLSSIGIIVP